MLLRSVLPASGGRAGASSVPVAAACWRGRHVSWLTIHCPASRSLESLAYTANMNRSYAAYREGRPVAGVGAARPGAAGVLAAVLGLAGGGIFAHGLDVQLSSLQINRRNVTERKKRNVTVGGQSRSPRPGMPCAVVVPLPPAAHPEPPPPPRAGALRACGSWTNDSLICVEVEGLGRSACDGGFCHADTI